MKNITFNISAFVLFFSLITFSFGQEKAKKIETVEFEVKGVCKMCKERIENAALIKGVKMVEWSKETQMLKVVFNNTKTSLETIQQSLAKAGHRGTDFTAEEKAYGKLPGCCRYDDGVEVH